MKSIESHSTISTLGKTQTNLILRPLNEIVRVNLCNLWTWLLLAPFRGLGAGLLIGIGLASCSESVDSIIPADGNIAYINFFNLSEVIRQSTDYTLSHGNMVYVNDSVPNGNFKNFPQFAEGNSDDVRAYPRHFTGTDVVVDYVSSGVYWMPIAADSYKFIFTSAGKVFLKDTTVTLAPDTYTTQYLVESPKADSAYTIVNVPVEPKAVEGKVRVQVVNLATDLGPVDVVQADDAGNEVASDLPQNLGFGSYNAQYTELDVATAGSNNRLLLKFRKSGNSEDLQTFALTATSGSTYTLVLRGFEKSAVRRMKIGENQYATEEITPALRVLSLRTY